uniref:Uncharacterized protein n=1 Tax=Anguilla anguilla TaxID=7936 RepID=A0A0E9PL33_ANGAN
MSYAFSTSKKAATTDSRLVLGLPHLRFHTQYRVPSLFENHFSCWDKSPFVSR